MVAENRIERRKLGKNVIHGLKPTRQENTAS
jgi:hypothetical protein